MGHNNGITVINCKTTIPFAKTYKGGESKAHQIEQRIQKYTGMECCINPYNVCEETDSRILRIEFRHTDES